jgi:hypothetical protein
MLAQIFLTGQDVRALFGEFIEMGSMLLYWNGALVVVSSICKGVGYGKDQKWHTESTF